MKKNLIVNKGFYLVWFGVLIYSMDTLLIKVSGVNGLLAAFWRGFFSFIILFIVFFTKFKKNAVGELKKGNIHMLFSGLLWAISGIFYTVSVNKVGTSISLIFLSLAPIISTVFEIVFLKEKCNKFTLFAIIVSFLGIGYMFHKGIGELHPVDLIYPVMVPFCMAMNYTLLRKRSNISRIGCSMIGGLLASIICFTLLKTRVAVSSDSLFYLMLLGLFVIPIGQIMITLGPKYLKVSEVTLIGSLESVWGLIYVWIFLGIIPSQEKIIGGLIVFSAIILNLLHNVMKEQKVIKEKQKC